MAASAKREIEALTPDGHQYESWNKGMLEMISSNGNPNVVMAASTLGTTRKRYVTPAINLTRLVDDNRTTDGKEPPDKSIEKLLK